MTGAGRGKAVEGYAGESGTVLINLMGFESIEETQRDEGKTSQNPERAGPRANSDVAELFFPKHPHHLPSHPSFSFCN